MGARAHAGSKADVMRQALLGQRDVLFAYFYGSRALELEIPGADIDVAVYLKPSMTNHYILRERELTGLLVSSLRTDAVDLRLLNVLPLILRYQVLKEGRLLFSRDEMARAEFETSVMIRYFELKPYLQEYMDMLRLRLRGPG